MGMLSDSNAQPISMNRPSTTNYHENNSLRVACRNLDGFHTLDISGKELRRTTPPSQRSECHGEIIQPPQSPQLLAIQLFAGTIGDKNIAYVYSEKIKSCKNAGLHYSN